MFDPNQFKINDYLNTSFRCDCGREHSVPIKKIIIQEKALSKLTGLLEEGGFQRPFFLFDETTYSLAGETIKYLLQKASLPYSLYTLPDAEPTPDEKTLGKILIHFDNACDLIVAVGSGTINDLSRFISFRLDLPYMIIATAPSMDGFASNVSPLIVDHMKTTYEAQVPYAILGDLAIIRNAPMNMIAAGVGDILGKYTCLCDWAVAHMLNGEYHCTAIEQLVRHSIATVTAGIANAKNRDAAAISSIMEALIYSGIAMSFAGNSRPASGSEHHLSHYWEMMYLFEGKKPVLHGTKVGIGTIAVLRAYELLFSGTIDFNKAREAVGRYNRTDWEAKMKKLYLDAAPSVIALEHKIGKNEPAHVVSRIDFLEKNWDKLKAFVDALPRADHIKDMLLMLDAPADPMSVGIDKATYINSFIAAKELRNRFGLLQILFDLDLTADIAEQTWKYFNEKSPICS